jgi:hypothetical protein
MNDDPHEAMERAYAVGDHERAHDLAVAVLANPGTPERAARARLVLGAMLTDPFLAVVGVLGLGLTVWLVYKYVL